MHEYLTGADIYANLVMMRTSDLRTVVLVEGDSDVDCIVNHVDLSSVVIIDCFGSRNLEDALLLSDSDRMPRVMAIRDRDWTGVLAFTPVSPNMILTDLYDFDATIMIGTPAGERVMRVFGDAARVAELCQAAGHASPIRLAVDIAGAVGLLRLASARLGLNLSLRDFPMHDIVGADGSLRVDRMLALAVGRSRDSTVDEVGLGALYLEESEADLPAERVCSGHDLGAALAALFRQCFGLRSVGKDLVLKSVRAGVACSEFRDLDLFKDVRRWERENSATVWHERCLIA